MFIQGIEEAIKASMILDDPKVTSHLGREEGRSLVKSSIGHRNIFNYLPNRVMGGIGF